jgi:large subunit ribosomal protein L1
MADDKIKASEQVEADMPKAVKAPKKATKATKASAKKAATPVAKKEAKPKREISEVQRLHGKKYADAVKDIDRTNAFELDQAVELLKKTSLVKFDASTEAHIRLGLDTRHQDQQLRGTVVLPAGTGKTKRVAVIASVDKQREAKDAGADLVGEDELIKSIEAGKAEFDVLVATPDVMGKIGRLGKVLGTKGLMPSPKAGTVTPDVGKAVKAIKAGQVEFRADATGIVHVAFGKVSFTEEQLKDNLKTLLNAIMQSKPTGAKGQYVHSIFVSTSMGPSFRLDQKVLSHLQD